MKVIFIPSAWQIQIPELITPEYYQYWSLSLAVLLDDSYKTAEAERDSRENDQELDPTLPSELQIL